MFENGVSTKLLVLHVCSSPAQHLRLATATTPPYAKMKHRRATLNPGSRLMLNPVWCRDLKHWTM